MRKRSDVIDYYHKDLLPMVREVEEKRKEVNRRRLAILGTVFIVTAPVFIVVVLLVLTSSTPDDAYAAGFLYIIFMVIFYYFLPIFTGSEFEKGFERKVADPLVKYIAPGLSYVSNNYISSSVFKKSRIIREEGIDRYGGKNYISGDILGVKTEFSNVHVEEERRYEEKVGEYETKTRITYETVFKGIFLRAEFPKRFSGNVLVLPDRIEGVLSSFLRRKLSYNSLKLERIKIDSPEFEKHFFIYGEDQIEARYILSHSTMERILRFRRKVGHKISLSFVEGDVFLAVHDVELSLAPSIHSSLLDREVAKKYIEAIFFLVGVVAVGFVEELKLDQKLWGKR